MTAHQIAGDHVIWEKLGNHVVIAELKTGKYCNIVNPTGVRTWELLTAGYNEIEIKDFFAAHYTGFDATAEKSVPEFLNKLRLLGFIMEVQPNKNSLKKELIFEGTYKIQFDTPELVVYDDIDTLLQIDPVGIA